MSDKVLNMVISSSKNPSYTLHFIV